VNIPKRPAGTSPLEAVSAVDPLLPFAPCSRHSEFRAAKPRAGRPQRTTSAVGPAGRLPGLGRFGGRAVHFAARTACAAHDAGESDHEACTACTPTPEPPKPGASHARCGLPARAFAATLWQLVRHCVAGERLGVRARRAVGGGEDRRPGGGARSALRKLTRRRRAQRAKRAEQSGRRAPRPRTAAESARSADRRGRPDVPVPQAARAHRCPQVCFRLHDRKSEEGRAPTTGSAPRFICRGIGDLARGNPT
jgi:hypothetical protein